MNEREEGQLEMAQAMIESLLELKQALVENPSLIGIWQRNPLGALTVVIETLEARHVRGLRPDQLEKRVVERMKRR